MAATVREVMKFIESYPPNWPVWIDDGGLRLVVASPNKAIVSDYEVGGERLDEEDK